MELLTLANNVILDILLMQNKVVVLHSVNSSQLDLPAEGDLALASEDVANLHQEQFHVLLQTKKLANPAVELSRLPNANRMALVPKFSFVSTFSRKTKHFFFFTRKRLNSQYTLRI